MKPIESVAVIGMGALGILYGSLVAGSLGPGCLQFIGEGERLRRFRASGVSCNGVKCPFVMAAPEEAVPPDLLIIATKSTGLADAIALASRLIRDDTIIISILNGVTSEEEIEAATGSRHVLRAVAQGMDATRAGGDMRYEHPGTLCVGRLPEMAWQEEDLGRVCAFLEKAGIPYEKDLDIGHRLWAKWLLNVGINQVCMLEETGYGGVQKPGPARDRMIGAMREALAVARGCGSNVTEADIDFYVALADTLAPEGMPSMRQDGLAKKPSEVEMFAGTVVGKAAALGIPVPINKAIYEEVRRREALY